MQMEKEKLEGSQLSTEEVIPPPFMHICLPEEAPPVQRNMSPTAGLQFDGLCYGKGVPTGLERTKNEAPTEV